MIRLHLLGSIELRHGDGTPARSVLAQPKRVCLLAYLAIARPRGFHRRDELLALFWPEKEDSRARNSLRQSLHFLRKSLGREVIRSRGDSEVGLDSDAFWVDVLEFERLARAGAVDEALSLYRGPLLDSFHVPGAPELDRCLEEERRRLSRLAWDLALKGGAAAAEQGDLDRAATLAHRATQMRPLNEVAARAHMAYLAEAGDRVAALRAYSRLVEGLRREFGTEPEAETLELLARITEGSPPTSEVATERPAAASTPQPGEPGANTGPTPDLEPTKSRLWRSPQWLAGAAAAVVMGGIYAAGFNGPWGSGELPPEAGTWPDHVLWVDDESGNNRREITRLRSRGVRVTTVTSTADALRVYDPVRHDVVLSDMGRHEEDDFDPTAGIALLRALRSTNPNARVVFFTSPRALAVTGGAAIAAGATGVTADADELFRLLQTIAPSERSRVVVADFESTPGQEPTARAFSLALRSDLERSGQWLVVPQEEIAGALVRMGLPASSPVSPTRAREVARRDGYGAVVSGQVASTLGGWVFSTSVHLPDGTLLHDATESVRVPSGILSVIDRLAQGVREALGENAATLRSRTPLPEVSTSSHEALVAFAAGVDQMAVSDYGAAQELFEQALSFDPLFASAWVHLGLSHRNRGQWSDAVAALEQARRLRDRLLPTEQLRLDFEYAEMVSGDMDDARAASEALIRARPDLRDDWLRQQILIAFRERRWVDGEDLANQLLQLLGGLPATSWWNLVALQLLNGHDAAVNSSLDRWEDDLGPRSQVVGARFRVAFQRQAWSRARAMLDRNLALYPSDRHGLDFWYALVDRGAGRLAEGERLHAAWEAEERERSGEGATVGASMWIALSDLEVRQDTARALQRLSRALAALDSVPPLALTMMAWVSALVGDVQEARRLLEQYDASATAFDLARPPHELRTAQAATLLAEGETEAAIRTLLRAREEEGGRPFQCDFCPSMLLGRAYEAQGDTTEAIRFYREYADARWVFGPDRQQDAAFLVAVRERLARLYEARGQLAEAANQYREVLRQWRDAGPELQPRLQAAREGLARTGG